MLAVVDAPIGVRPGGPAGGTPWQEPRHPCPGQARSPRSANGADLADRRKASPISVPASIAAGCSVAVMARSPEPEMLPGDHKSRPSAAAI